MPLPKYSHIFERYFWKEYPLKTGKGAAWRKWEILIQGEDELAFGEMIFEHLKERNRFDAKWLEGKYIPHPATFLNQARWEDDYPRIRKQAPSHAQFETVEEAFQSEFNPAHLDELAALRKSLH